MPPTLKPSCTIDSTLADTHSPCGIPVPQGCGSSTRTPSLKGPCFPRFASRESIPLLSTCSRSSTNRFRLLSELGRSEPAAALRWNQSAHGPSDFLKDGAENLAIVLSHFRGQAKRQLVEALHELFDGIVDVSCPVTGGTVALFLEERGGRQIPATLLSDGTLRLPEPARDPAAS